MARSMRRRNAVAAVLRTIEAVRRVYGRNFAVQVSERRPGDMGCMGSPDLAPSRWRFIL
jgi:UDP-glucose 4-epimerase